MIDKEKKNGYPINIRIGNDTLHNETQKVEEVKEEVLEEKEKTEDTLHMEMEENYDSNNDTVIDLLDSLKLVYKNNRRK